MMSLQHTTHLPDQERALAHLASLGVLSPKSQARPQYQQLEPLITESQYPPRRVFAMPVYTTPTYSSPLNETHPSMNWNPMNPGYVAVGQYYRHGSLVTAFQQTPVARRISGPVPPHLPRRHSSISSANGLAGRLNRVAVTTPTAPVAQVAPIGSIEEESRQQLLAGVTSDQEVQLRTIVGRRRSTINPHAMKNSSLEHTYKRLRHWGHAYLDNKDTADVLVKAIHLRPLSPPTRVASGEAEDTNMSDDTGASSTRCSSETPLAEVVASKKRKAPESLKQTIVVRARITPIGKKPFVIQRSFNVAEMRSRIPSARTKLPDSRRDDNRGAGSAEGLSSDGNSQTPPRRQSTPGPLSRPIAQLPTTSSTSKAPLPRSSTANARRVISIHVEYAIHYLPVLAGLMLSGHVRRGDIIELPIPRPEAWAATVAWVYTAEGEVTDAIAENVEYLGGKVR